MKGKKKMCTRQELRQLLHELLYRLDQVAYLGARTQFNEECNSISNAQRFGAGVGGGFDKIPYANGNVHFENILRFQRAYFRYFVFALDPYTEFIVPMKSSSLALFINNILSRDGPTQQSSMTGHTSRTIIEFLQVSLKITANTKLSSKHVVCACACLCVRKRAYIDRLVLYKIKCVFDTTPVIYYFIYR